MHLTDALAAELEQKSGCSEQKSHLADNDVSKNRSING